MAASSVANYDSELVRLASFSSCSSLPPCVSAITLARTGFRYSDDNDTIVCHWCDYSLCGWRAKGKDPVEEHRSASPNCITPPSVNNPLTILDGAMVIGLTLTRLAVPALGVDGPRDGDEGQDNQLAPSAILAVYKSAVRRATGSGLLPADRCVPDRDAMRDEGRRLETFHDWPTTTSGVSPADLARQGFVYTGVGDTVVCVFCNGHIKGWLPGCDPQVVHRTLFGDNYCSFINGDAVQAVDVS